MQTVDHYSNCTLYRLDCGAFCLSNIAIGRADCLFVTIEVVRCTFCALGLTVSARLQQVVQTDY